MDSISATYGDASSDEDAKTIDTGDDLHENHGLNKTFIPSCEKNLKPYVGQLFLSIDDAFEYYSDYGRSGGFDVRKSSQKRFRDGTISSKYFVCSKSGIGESLIPFEDDLDSVTSWTSDNSSTNKSKLPCSKSNKKKRITMSFKCLCNAKLVVKFAGLQGYVVNKFVEEHSHELASDSEKQFLRANRCMTDLHMKFVFGAGLCNIGPTRAFSIFKAMCGSYCDIGATTVDFKNWARDIQNYIGKHDADMLLQKFKDKPETSDTRFSYEYETDSSGHLLRLFWADGIGRRNYELFGDVVSFDPTYRTNKYGMVFVPFICIDNHWKSITVAAALLDKEDVGNFKWVFEVFLKVMGRPPKCIITYQCPAMKQVIPKLFPDSIHRFCMWYIMMKFPAKVGTLFCAESLFMKELQEFVWSDYISISEFEDGWHLILKKYGLEDHIWLAEMFELRKCWIPAYFVNDPMVGLLRTTSRSESSNFYFSHFVQKGDTLCQFFMCFESAIEKQRYVRNKLNLQDKSLPRTDTTKPIEKDAASFYTRAIFYKVQAEIKASSNMELHNLRIEESLRKYVIKDPRFNKLFEVI